MYKKALFAKTPGENIVKPKTKLLSIALLALSFHATAANSDTTDSARVVGPNKIKPAANNEQLDQYK